jgi:hypothetical protein
MQPTLEGSTEASGSGQNPWRLSGARAKQPVHVLGVADAAGWFLVENGR